MAVKTRKTISVDPRVWERIEREAGRLRVSHSWVAETAFRKYLRISEPRPRKGRPGDIPPPPSAQRARESNTGGRQW